MIHSAREMSDRRRGVVPGFRRLLSGVRGRLRRPTRTTHVFLPAPSIRIQTMAFEWMGRVITISSGHSTPLYETIAEVVDYDCYRLRELAPEALRGTTLIDIGANVGVTTLCLAQFPDVGVVSFEPDPTNRGRLKENVASNDASCVTVRAEAVAAANGTARLLRPPNEDVGGQLEGRDDSSAAEGRTVIDVVTLDLRGALERAGPANVGLVKIDCEGAEYDIVPQITPDVAARLPRLTFEVHERGPGRRPAEIRERLNALGYRLAWKSDPFGRASLVHLFASRLD